MSEYQKLSKSESLEVISLFNTHTKNIEEPMIGFYGDGAMSLEEATVLIEEGLEPEGISICGKRPAEDYWDSVFIHKDEEGDFLVTTGDMSGVPDRYTDDIETAMIIAQKSLIEYIEESRYYP